ncbi:MAG: hypothetical protein CMH57_10380 [Myxococcales bacterium]|nr:hypothetical protein [Myxococcales bacterium]
METANPTHQLTGRKLAVKLGGTTILNGIDFAARSGQLIGVLGPSGSGKSTLLMALSGFRPATGGVVLFKRKDLYKEFEALKTHIGFVPQDDIVPTQLRVERVVKYAAELRLPDLSKEEREQRIDSLLGMLDLQERRRLRVNKLSGGQRKRVSIAVELLAKPELFFADEPTSGLDPALEMELMKLLRRMATQGRIVIVTTHIMSSLSLLDLICVLHKGRLAYFGPPDQIKPYFKVSDFSEIYHLLGTREPNEWESHFKRHPFHQKYLASQLQGGS